MDVENGGMDTEYSDFRLVVCPYCGYVRNDSAEDLELGEIEGTRDEECEKCGETFEMTWEVRFYFSTSKKAARGHQATGFHLVVP